MSENGILNDRESGLNVSENIYIPEEGRIIEYTSDNGLGTCFVAYCCGRRIDGMLCAGDCLHEDGYVNFRFFVKYWRFPGEIDWKK